MPYGGLYDMAKHNNKALNYLNNWAMSRYRKAISQCADIYATVDRASQGKIFDCADDLKIELIHRYFARGISKMALIVHWSDSAFRP